MLIAHGARSVLASLWFADDASTAVLMRHFYDGWCRRGLTQPVALREAQLALLAGATEPSRPRGIAVVGRSAPQLPAPVHPYQWAAFQLMA